MIQQPLAAQAACGEANLRFARTFRSQFVLTENPDLQLADFRTTQIGHWHLYSCQALPYARLQTADGGFAGLLLGIAVDASGKRIMDGYQLGPSETPEHLITQAAGRYVFITSTHVYSDPTGSMGGVYDATTRTVASTVLMCLDRPPVAPDGFDPEAVLEGHGAYSLSYTRDHAVRAITPNHRLNLADFTVERFWPGPEVNLGIGDPPAIISRMARRLSDVIGAIARSAPTHLPLSGGRDSRNLAACALPHLSDIRCSFTFVMNWQAQIDAEIAAQIARRLGLNHTNYRSFLGDGQGRKTLPPDSRQRQKLAFRLAGGYVGDASNEVLDGLCRLLPRGLILRGNVMELLKANHWKRGLTRDRQHHDGVDLDYATARLAIHHDREAEAIERFRGEYTAWYDALPDPAKRVHYDLAFVEHLLPGWQPKFYGYTRNFFVNPFSDRSLILGCLQLPVKERQNNLYNDALLAHAAPDLVGLPFTPDVKLARRSAA